MDPHAPQSEAHQQAPLLDQPGSQAERDAAQRNRVLAKAVEYEILPRLMLAHRLVEQADSVAATNGPAVSPTEVFEFSRLVMDGDDASLSAAAAAVLGRGISLQGLLLDLLAPTARHLGELWERDLCDFNEVTVALGRLQRILREHSQTRAPHTAPSDGPARSILLAPCPGEQHTFGLSVVAEFFHQAHWQVSAGHLSAEVDPARLASEQWFDVIGLSLGSSSHLNKLIQCMQDIRRCSRNTGVRIILGGPIFTLHPEYASQLDADAVITDGSAAPVLAQRLLAGLTNKV
jgi:methanogenic corrinoid protein MtbC1